MDYVTDPLSLVFGSWEGLACVICCVVITRIIVKLDVFIDIECI